MNLLSILVNLNSIAIKFALDNHILAMKLNGANKASIKKSVTATLRLNQYVPVKEASDSERITRCTIKE